jgi:hypothetical protein
MRGMRFGGVIAALVAALSCVPGALSAPPSNDHFASPTLLTGLEGSPTTTNAEATKEAGEPDHAGDAGGASVWFSWTAPRSGVLLIDTCDSSFDTLLAVYTGSAVNALTQVAANDDSCALQSELGIDVVSGTEYRIAVDGAGGGTGSVVLWFAMPPANDDFEDAQALAGEFGSTTSSVRWATHELNEPLHAGQPGTGSVWYAWTAPGNLRATFDTCQSGGGTFLAVYTGSSIGSLDVVGSDFGQCNYRGSVSFDAVGGTTYRVAVDSDGSWDTATLGWRTTPLLPRNVSPPTIGGEPRTNTLLVASPGTWLHAASFLYHWESCPNATPATGTCTPIYARNELPFDERLTGPAELLGRHIRVQVQAAGPGGHRVVRSATVGPVTPGPPVNKIPPEVDGYTIVGEKLEAGEGEWDFGGGTRVGVTYLWHRCDRNAENCRPVRGPDGNKEYVATSADRGSVIQVVVTMTSTGGSASAAGYSAGEITLPERAVRQRRCVVPRLVGKSLKAGRKSLARARCRLGAVRRMVSRRRAGVIVAQRPKAGTRLRAGGRVNVVLSLGRRR